MIIFYFSVYIALLNAPLHYSLFFCSGIMTLHSWNTQMNIDLLEVVTLPSYQEEIWSDCFKKKEIRDKV